MQRLEACLFVVLLCALPAFSQSAWVDKATLCTPVYDPPGYPPGTVLTCSFPTASVLVGTGVGNPYWLMSGGVLQYWTAVDFLKSPGGDSCQIQDMVEAPDHAVWATSPSSNAVCQAQTTDPTGATIVAFPMPSGSSPDSIVAGNDGLLWVTAGGTNSLLHLDLRGNVIDQFALPNGSQPKGVALAPDGNLWIALYGSAALAHFDPTTGTLTSTTPLPSTTHPYALKATAAQVCYLGSNPNYAGCIDSSGKLLSESALPAGTRDVSNRGQMIIGPDGSVWFADSALDLLRFDEGGALVPYAIGINGIGIAGKSDGIDFVFNAADGSSGISTFRAAFTGVAAAPSEVAEGGLFTLSGTLTQLVADPAPLITMPQATLSATSQPLPAQANIRFAQDFILEAASGTGTIEAFFNSGTHTASISTALVQTNSPPSLENLVTTPTVIVGAETMMISGIISDAGTKDTFTVTVDWGDNWPPGFIQTSSSFSLSHTYFVGGTYTLRYTITDLGGASLSGTTSVSAIVPQSPTSTTLSASVTSIFSGEAVTLKAVVKGATTSTVTGAVQFNDGSNVLGNQAVDASGVATLTTTLTIPGAHSISAIYAGNTTYLGSASSPAGISVNPAIFTFTVSPTSQTIFSGASASYTLTLMPSGSYTSEISFSCKFSPSSSATCSAQPVIPGASPASTLLTISGAQPAAKVKVGNTGSGNAFWLYGCMPIAIGALFRLAQRKPGTWVLRHSLLANVILLLPMMLACGSSSSSSQPIAQTYQVTITARGLATPSGSSAAMKLTQVLSLIVRQ